MKKINSKKHIIGAITCMSLALTISASYSPATADPLGGAPIVPGQIGAEAGMNQMHDSSYLKERYQDNYRNEDYQY